MNLNKNSENFAPIVLFAFNRPNHLKIILSSLSKNPEFYSSPLFIYCDGIKYLRDSVNVSNTIAIANEFPHPNKKVIRSDINLGLAKSIIFGVTQVINIYGQAIVLEDDLEVEVSFLKFLNEALSIYKNNPNVMQISAYMFPIPEFITRSEVIFLNNISSWGWATWSHAWKKFDPNAYGWELLITNKELRRNFDVSGSYSYSDMLIRQIKGEIDSWAILWNWSVFRNSGLIVYPPVSLVKNNGFDGSGTHCDRIIFNNIKIKDKNKSFKFTKETYLPNSEFLYIKAALKRMEGPFYLRIIKLILNTFRRLKIKYNNKY
jgi:hypothetical protein